jgi:two-component system sensor histidine kinase KdpD
MSIAPLLLASTLSALVWNFFFIPPYYTFHIDKPEDILLFAMFFMIAMLNGVLTSRLRQQEELARERERHSNALFDLTSKLAKANGINELKEIAVRSISKEFGVNSVIKLNYDTSEPYNISKNDTGRVFQLKGTRVNLGVAILDSSKEIEDNVFFTAYLSQITNALEREYLAELAQKARFLDESDRLYKTLFNSISHELRIPVATIMGAAESLLSLKHSESVRTELSNEIFTASARLNRVIENLLNMSRLESGRISVRLDWHDMNDLINKVIADLEFELRNLIVTVEMSEDLPLVRIDFGLMEQVLYNLLFNSSEHSPAGSEIIIKISSKNEMFEIVIMDQGPGFPKIKFQMYLINFLELKAVSRGD